jgi:hypothetical protein
LETHPLGPTGPNLVQVFCAGKHLTSVQGTAVPPFAPYLERDGRAQRLDSAWLSQIGFRFINFAASSRSIPEFVLAFVGEDISLAGMLLQPTQRGKIALANCTAFAFSIGQTLLFASLPPTAPMAVIQFLNGVGTWRSGIQCAGSMIEWYNALQSHKSLIAQREEQARTPTKEPDQPKASQEQAEREAFRSLQELQKNPVRVTPANNGFMDKVQQGLSNPPPKQGSQPGPAGSPIGTAIIVTPKRPPPK